MRLHAVELMTVAKFREKHHIDDAEWHRLLALGLPIQRRPGVRWDLVDAQEWRDLKRRIGEAK